MAALQIGQVIEEFKILGRLGEGGMGVVYKALDTALDRVVALKTIGGDLVQDEFFLKRFRTEAQALAKLKDPNIVTIFALRETEIGLLMVMEFVDGLTLAQKIKQSGRLEAAEALPMVKQILTALGHAHQAGVIHRDIKPSNVMLTPQGEVKVTDFGLAKIQRGTETTLTMFAVGTLLYMSPEQVKNSALVAPRSDIYSLGMTLYEMLAGRTPFESGLAPVDIQNAILAGKFPSPERFNPDIPPALAQIVMQALAVDPGRRFQNTEAMLAAIEKFAAPTLSPNRTQRQPLPAKAPLASENPKRRFVRLAAAAMLAFIVLALGSYKLLWRPSPRSDEQAISTPADSRRAPIKTPDSTQSALIKELAAISDLSALNKKLRQYEQDMQISVGSRQDFDPLNGCYVFIADKNAVLGVFLFNDNNYCDVNSGAAYATLPEQYSGKTAIWVKDYGAQ